MRLDIGRPLCSTKAVGVIFHLADGTIQSCNIDAEIILGYTVEQLIGASSFDPPWQTIHEDGSLFSPETYPATISLETGRPCSDLVMGFYRPDGDLVWLSIATEPLFKANNTKPYGVEVTFKDISDRIGNDISLQFVPKQRSLTVSKEERLNLATVAAGLGMWFWDLKTDCLEWTELCKALFGLTPDTEMSYEVFLNALHPEDRDRTDTAIRQALATKTEYNIEYRTVWSDGSIHWILAKGRAFYNSEGEPLQMMGTTQDVSDRKLLEAKLTETNNTLESIIRDTNDAIFVKDLEGRYVTINQAALTWLGMTVEDVVGRDDTALFDSETAQSLRAIDRQVIEQNKSVILEEKATSGTQQRTFLSSKHPWYDASGNLAGVIGISKDITEIKESQQKIQEKEQLLRLALSCASAASWNWDLTTGKVTWSQENFDLYGLAPEIEPKYEIWESVVHPDDRERANREIERVIADPTSELKIEFRIIHSQKGIRWILAMGHVTCNDNGEPICFSGIDLDISDRKEAEQKIQQSEQHLRRVLDSLYSFIGVLNPDGILLEANQTAIEAANLKLEDVIGKPFTEAYWWSYSKASQARLNAALERAKRGEAVRYDVEVRLSEDNYVTIDFALVPLFDANGEVEWIIPSGIDISDREANRKALEQREDELRLMTEAIPQQIWTALPNGETDYFNQRWQDYTGLTVEQAKHRGWEYMIHPEDLEEVNQMWDRVISTSCNYDLKTRLRRADGEFQWFLVRATPLRNQQGEIVKWYGTNTNIHQIKQLEAKLQQQTEDLIQANRLKDEFLAIVSHELRTPLNPILGWSQLLAGGRLDPERYAQGAGIIERNAKLQAQLIDDLLDVSRILRGKLDLKVTPLNLESVIRSALTTVQLAAEAKSIQIKTSIEPNIGEVMGDAGRLQQIVWNLVSNAIKFTPEGGRITVTLERVATQALIQVIDTGKGIDPEFLPYVFDRFRQAESTTTRKYGGLGLGLAIVKHLTELHGGTVAADSPGEGRGSSFSVRLPLINTPTVEHSDSEWLNKPEATNSLNGLQVLIVDDEADSLDLLTLVLEQEGAMVTAVTSAKEAVSAFNQSTPNLIISDIGIPEVDGYTLITQIRELPQGKNIPAIALTAYAGEVDIQRSLDVGFQQHISKPINIAQAIDIITQLILINVTK